jgi:hypothetical protein
MQELTTLIRSDRMNSSSVQHVLMQWLRELRAWYPPFRVVILHDSARSQLSARPSRKCATSACCPEAQACVCILLPTCVHDHPSALMACWGTRQKWTGVLLT